MKLSHCYRIKVDSSLTMIRIYLINNQINCTFYPLTVTSDVAGRLREQLGPVTFEQL